MSRAIALRQATLRLAARKGADLNLISLEALPNALHPSLQTAAADARHSLLLGTSTPGLARGIAATAAAQGHGLTVIEPEAALLHAELPDLCAGHNSVTAVVSDPTNLRIDPRGLNELIAKIAPVDFAGYRALGKRIGERANATPFIPDNSVDLVVIDMLANRLTRSEYADVLMEAFRVLRRHGRLIVIVLAADEPLTVPRVELGAWAAVRCPLETELSIEVGAAGFHGLTYSALFDRPLQTVKGVELRPLLFDGYKGKQGVCLDQGHAVIYRGPWREVHDDDGHRYMRGQRTAVCSKTHELLMRAPYRGQFISMPCYAQVPLEEAPSFDCNTPALRDPAVTKGRVSLFANAGSRPAAECCEPVSDGQPCCP